MTSAPARLRQEDTGLLVSALERASYVIRIANDLNTAERDHRGNAANALPLAAGLWACSAPEARYLLRKTLEQELNQLFTAAATITPAIADHYGWTVRSAVFACQWYLNQNELELTPEDLRTPPGTD